MKHVVNLSGGTKKKMLMVERVLEDDCRRVASVIGSSSAAQRALDDLKYRRAKGEQVFLAFWRNTWLVLPEDCVVRAK